MPAVPPPPVPTQLIVFADDWGRHPSSSQHLIRELLPQYPTLWVNTVGTRRPRLTWSDLRRAVSKIGSMIGSAESVVTNEDLGLPDGLRVIQPLMYPGFRSAWQRRFNRNQVRQTTHEVLGQTWTTTPLTGGASGTRPRRVAITTLPITADLVGAIDVDRWVYYCVDDYSQWPGTDHAVMDAMERELIAKVGGIACVSETLRERMADLGRNDSTLLTHGVDPAMWQTPATDSLLSPLWPKKELPISLFWGLIDARLDSDWLAALGVHHADLHLVLAGPSQGVTPLAGSLAVEIYPNEIGPIPYKDLAAHAAAASVLIMPYIDAPVTRAMQPLKLKEYLATMKPVVVRDLPSTRGWADCCDLADNADDFVRLVLERIKTGTPAEQLAARRRRLPGESWAAKAAQLAEVINAT